MHTLNVSQTDRIALLIAEGFGVKERLTSVQKELEERYPKRKNRHEVPIAELGEFTDLKDECDSLQHQYEGVALRMLKAGVPKQVWLVAETESGKRVYACIYDRTDGPTLLVEEG